MILVTGGTGLVGAHLLYKLVSDNKHVKATYRNEKSLEKTKRIFSYYSSNYKNLIDKITWVKADITNIPELTLAFNKVTYVYHCAAFISFDEKHFQALRKINIEGTANIVNLCLAYNIKKLCYVSSVATLGTPLKGTPATENTIWNPESDNNVYAISKYGAEMEVWRATQEGLDVVMVNPGVIIGPGIWDAGTGILFKKARKGLAYYTTGNVPLVAVNDVVLTMINLLNSPIKNKRFVIVAKNYSYKVFLEMLAKAGSSKPPKKIAAPWLLSLAWKLDWIKSTLSSKPRALTKHIAEALQNKTTYNNANIITAINYNFTAIETCIEETGSLYLKEKI